MISLSLRREAGFCWRIVGSCTPWPWELSTTVSEIVGASGRSAGGLAEGGLNCGMAYLLRI